ncbi:MAG: hypothetical protein ABSA11_16815 [Candidatus Bathyarchaeia archaeon]
MVDLGEIQAAYYMVAATGVLVAAIYYILNLRETRRNGRIALANNIIQKMTTSTGMRIYIDLLNYEWTDYDDFEKKYGSDNNPDSYAKRYSTWQYYNNLGFMVRDDVIDADRLFDLGGNGVPWLWAKFESVIRTQRKLYSLGSFWLWGFEYLSGEMLKVAKRRDPSYKIPDSYARYVPDK